MDSSKKQWHNNVMNTDFLPAGPSSLWSGNRLSQVLVANNKGMGSGHANYLKLLKNKRKNTYSWNDNIA